MLSNKSWGIAGAAMLGTAALLGTNAAYALKIDLMNEVAVYATETVVETDAVDKDGTMYYKLMRDHTLKAPLGVGTTATSDRLTIKFTLDGMVFSTALANTSLEICPAPTGEEEVEDIINEPADCLNQGVSRLLGGAAGGDSVTFSATGTQAVVSSTNIVKLVAKYAISAAGSGSVTMTTTNITLSAILQDEDFSETEGPREVIMLASGLDEKADDNDVVATVESGFTMFGDSSVANLGSLTITHKKGHRDASFDGNTEPLVMGLPQLADTGDDGDGDPNSTVTIMGDFSFADMVFLHGDADCGAVDPENPTQSTGVDTSLASPDDDLLIRGDDMMISDATKIMSVNVNDFAMPMHLCIVVDSEDEDLRIPDAGPYMASASYKALANKAFDPMGEDQALGSITRDGTTVHLPYVTTFEGYNQRIVLSNRGTIDAAYQIEFRPEEGVTATAGMRATGTLKGKSTVTMPAVDVVSLDGGKRTAATIILEAQPKYIDVTSVTVNKESRDTDTVVHHSGS